VFRTGPFEATIDAYQIEIRNRIVLSENLSSPAVTALLAPFAVTQARFFINGVETRTRGIDAVVHYLLETDAAGKFDFTGAANVNSTDVLSVKTGTSSLPGVVLFSRQNQLRYEEGTPKNKIVLGTDWTYPVSFGAFGIDLRGTRYGKVLSPGTAADGSLDFHIDSATVVDLSVHADIHDHWTAAIGADNLLDQYPNKLPPLLNTTGATGFSQFSPFGFNGRFVYARVGYKW
jgi:iron complex outermembrane receptor protein